MSFSILENIPKTPVAAGSAAAALYIISEVIFSSDMIEAIKSSPNIAAVVIAFIGFAAAYTIAKYIAYALEKKDVARHEQVEGWFYQTQHMIDLLRNDLEIMRDEQTADSDAFLKEIGDLRERMDDLDMGMDYLSSTVNEISLDTEQLIEANSDSNVND